MSSSDPSTPAAIEPASTTPLRPTPSASSRLVCGRVTGHSPLAKTLSHLSETLDSLVKEFHKPYGSAEQVHPLFSPFLARSVLEISCTALIARLDPFRVLTLAAVQSHADYVLGKRAAAALQWQGDVMSDGKDKMGLQDRRPSDMSRALLGDTLEAIVWKPAFEAFLDTCSKMTLGPRAQSLQNLSAESFLPRSRGMASSTFSIASKGVHHEFVLPHTSYYDTTTLEVLVDDAMHICADLGVVANWCEHIPFSMPPIEALVIYEEIT